MIQLSLTPQEARTLFDLLGNVHGDSKTTTRKHTESILYKFYKMGFVFTDENAFVTTIAAGMLKDLGEEYQ